MISLFKILMPIAAAALLCEAVAERDAILGIAAFGILRAWWKDILDADGLKMRQILERIARWVIFGGVVDACWNARSYEEYTACAVVVVLLWLWRQGKLGGLWHASKDFRLPDIMPSGKDVASVHRVPSVLDSAVTKDDAARKREYEKETESAQKEYARFLERVAAFKSRYGLAVARFEKLKGMY